MIFSCTAFMVAAALALPQEVNPALFPGLDARGPTEIELAGLSVLYPGRVLREAPRAPDPGNANRVPLVAELPRGVTYLRVYDLAAALPRLTTLLPRPAMIVDMRYIVGDAPEAEQFAGVLARAGLGAPAMQAIGEIPQPARLIPSAPSAALGPPPPLVILVNRQTAGPLEAWLAAFQATENVVIVGRPTSGQSGEYQRFEGGGGMYILSGELQPAGGSIVGKGVTPNFVVEVSPEQDFRAYQQVERGATPSELLRHDRPATPPASGNGNGASAPAAPAQPAAQPEELGDAILQRAVDVVAALQVLGRMPSLPATSATRPAAASPASPPSPPPGQN